jgi:hypothetical protein
MSQLGAFSPAIRTFSALLCAGAAIGLVDGCIIVNTEHCGYKQNGCPEGYVCNVCAPENNGCVPIGQAESIKPVCLDSGGGASTVTATDATDPTVTPPTGTGPVDPSTGTASDTMSVTDTMSTSTTGTSATTMAIDCDPDVVVDNAQCGAQYCLPSGTCGSCEELPPGSECAALDPSRPICDGDTGVCGQCSARDTSMCPAETPACDAGTCTGCTEHAQCPAACDIHTGMCFPEQERVYYVRGSLACPGLGTMDLPFCNFLYVPLAPGQPTTIKVMPGQWAPGALAVPDDAVVAVVREGDQLVDIDGTNNASPTIAVTGAQSRVYVHGLNFRKAPSPHPVMRCDGGAQLWLHATTIAGNLINEATAIAGTDCRIRVVRSTIRECGAGIAVSGGDLRVESSFLLLNGNGGDPPFGAFSIGGAGPKVHVAYVSILLNKATSTTSVFHCDGGPWDVTVRNSAVLGVTPMETMGCAAYDGGIMDEAIDADEELATVGAWFTPFPGGLYSPKADGPLVGQAMWGDGDPLLDFNGQPIPQGVQSAAGAIQPP